MGVEATSTTRSFNLLVPGLTPPASASQLGILAPFLFKDERTESETSKVESRDTESSDRRATPHGAHP